MMAVASAGVSAVTTVPLIKADGSWSAIPISLVHATVNSASGEASPIATPAASAKASATWAAPFIGDIGVFDSRI